MRVLVYRPCAWGLMQPSTCTWIASIKSQLAQAGFANVDIAHFESGSSRIALGRNQAAEIALTGGFDYLLMIDPDMQPDLYLGENEKSKPFIESSLELLKEHPLSIVGAPATMPRPNMDSNVRLFYEGSDPWRTPTKKEVATRVREPLYEHVPVIGSGLLFIDVRAFDRIEQPWFRDLIDKDWKELILTQDYYFCNHAAGFGIKTFANWYSFCGHWHFECLGAPTD